MPSVQEYLDRLLGVVPTLPGDPPFNPIDHTFFPGGIVDPGKTPLLSEGGTSAQLDQFLGQWSIEKDWAGWFGSVR